MLDAGESHTRKTGGRSGDCCLALPGQEVAGEVSTRGGMARTAYAQGELFLLPGKDFGANVPQRENFLEEGPDFGLGGKG